MGLRRVVAALGIVLVALPAYAPAAHARAGDGAFETDTFVETGEPGACDQLAGADRWELLAAGCPLPDSGGDGQGEVSGPPPPPPPGPADLAVSQPPNSYAIVVENLGPGTATGVVLRGLYSSSLNVGFPGVSTSRGTCSAPPVNTPVGPAGVPFSCDLGTLVPGETATVTLGERRWASSAAAVPFLGFLSISRSSVASVSASTPDPNPDNNTSSLTYIPSIQTADSAPPPPDNADDS